MPDNLTHGNVCDYDFYVVNFNGGKAKLPTDTPDKFHLSIREAMDEFKRQCAANPANYTTAIGVDFTVHEENHDLNGGHSVGSIDFDNEFVDVAHTITTDAYKQLNDAVVSTYDKLALSGEKTIKNDFGFDKNKPTSSTIDVSLHNVNGASKVVAAGQVKIDDFFMH